MTTPDTDKKTLTHVDMLDSLIEAQFDELRESAKEHPQIGDFIKMVDLRRKLAPNKSEQKQYWQMLEDLRREMLPAEKSPAASEKTKEASGKGGEKK